MVFQVPILDPLELARREREERIAAQQAAYIDVVSRSLTVTRS
jgi:hypothetical protein